MIDYSRISIIGDEDTIIGFEIAGLASSEDYPTISKIDRNDSSEKIEKIFKSHLVRKDIAIILICDFASKKIKHEILKNKGCLPSVLIIPSKNKSQQQ